MNTVIKRRITRLERTWPRRKSLADFERDAINLVRLTGITYESAFQSLLADLSHEDLNRLAAEFEWAAFGNDTAAAEAARRKAIDGVGSHRRA